MSEPYIGEIRMFGGNFAMQGWAFCDGSLLPISQYDALFALLGTTYGGDGQTTFALPNLLGRVPIHMGTSLAGISYVQGQNSGQENHTLVTNEMAQHTHSVSASTTGNNANPSGRVYGGGQSNVSLYMASPGGAIMNAGVVQAAGGNQPHENMMPFLAVTFVIALEGIFPSQN